MAEVQYVSSERFEEYQKLVNQRFDDVSKMVKHELDSRLDDLRREATYNAKRRMKRRTLFTMTYLAAGGYVAAVIVLYAFILFAI